MSNNNIECKLKSLNLCKIFNIKTIQEERLTFLNLSVKSDMPSAVNTNGQWLLVLTVCGSLSVSTLFDYIQLHLD